MYGNGIALTSADAEPAKRLEFEPLLVERLQSGDQAAFDEVFHAYHKLVFRLAYRLLGEHEEALDLSQEVFLTIYKKIKKFRGEASLKTWIYRIVVTRAANRRRWWKKRMKGSVISLDAHLNAARRKGIFKRSLASVEPTPFETVYGLEIESKINQALQTLSIDQRAAIVMRDVERLSYEEIAEVTKVSLGTVKSRIARGRDELHRKLKGLLR